MKEIASIEMSRFSIRVQRVRRHSCNNCRIEWTNLIQLCEVSMLWPKTSKMLPKKKEVTHQLISENVMQLQVASRSIEQIMRPSTLPAQSKNVITRIVIEQLAANGSWTLLMNEKTPIAVDMICDMLRLTIEQEIYANLTEIKKSAR